MSEAPTPNPFEDLNRFASMVTQEADRGLALTMAAFLDDLLGRLLLAYLREGASAQDLVEGYNAPLGTFASRIKAVHALGLLSDEQRRDLDLIRKIRNEFAHNWEATTFDDPQIAGLLDRLPPSRLDAKSTERTRTLHFRGACAVLQIEINVQLIRVQNGGRLMAKAVHAASVSQVVDPDPE